MNSVKILPNKLDVTKNETAAPARTQDGGTPKTRKTIVLPKKRCSEPNPVATPRPTLDSQSAKPDAPAAAKPSNGGPINKNSSEAAFVLKLPQTAPKKTLLTEDNLALEFAKLLHKDLQYCHSTGAWYYFNRNRWQRDRTQRVFAMVRKFVRSQSWSAPATARHAMGKIGFIFGVERCARSDEKLAITADDWDRDPFLLGTPDGTVDLMSGQLRPARRYHQGYFRQTS
jgi:hypothetical protein